MCTMKKFVLLLVLAALCCFPQKTGNASAEIGYSRITDENVVLYMDGGMTAAWFTLPYGYYVKVLSVTASSVRVEYKGDDKRPSAKGYISSEYFSPVSETPKTPFPSLILTVNQTCLLYKDTDFSYTETVTQNSTVDFYGTYIRSGGGKYVYGYVSTTSGDKYVGYIPIEAVYEFTEPRLEIEPDPEPEKRQDDEKKEEPAPAASDAAGNTLQIVVIVAVSLIAVSIVYFLFRPSKVRPSGDAAGEDE